jgi:hypothetical protein
VRKDDITEKQAKYIRLRIKGLSQRKAYLEAYPASKRWKPESVDTAASILESNDKIYTKVKQGRKRALESAIEDGIIEGKDILRELANMGFAKLTDFVSVHADGVYIKPTDYIPEEKHAALASIKQTQFGIEIKLQPKIQALTKLGEAIGLFDQRTEEGEDDGFIDAVSGAAKTVWDE